MTILFALRQIIHIKQNNWVPRLWHRKWGKLRDNLGSSLTKKTSFAYNICELMVSDCIGILNNNNTTGKIMLNLVSCTTFPCLLNKEINPCFFLPILWHMALLLLLVFFSWLIMFSFKTKFSADGISGNMAMGSKFSYSSLWWYAIHFIILHHTSDCAPQGAFSHRMNWYPIHENEVNGHSARSFSQGRLIPWSSRNVLKHEADKLLL